jgi:hypothetical protein
MGTNPPSRNLTPFSFLLGEAGDRFVAQIEADQRMLDLIAEGAPFSRASNTITRMRSVLSEEQSANFGDTLEHLATAIGEVADVAGTGENAERSIKFKDPIVASAVLAVMRDLVHGVRMPEEGQVIRRSAFISMISDFESLVAAVAKAVLSETTDLIPLDDSTISLAELNRLGDIAAARNAIVARKVDEILRGSVVDWGEWFGKIGVKWHDMGIDWPEFVELFARRNAHVHAGGAASEQYLQFVRSAGGDTSSVRPGEELLLSRTYVQTAATKLLAFGILLVGGVWLQVEKKNTAAAENWLVNTIQYRLDNDDFEAVYLASNRILSAARDRWSRSRISIIQTANWVAGLHLGKEDSVRKAVAAWDTDGLDLVIAHAKTVILGPEDRAVKEVSKLLGEGRLTLVDLVVNPLYRSLVEMHAAQIWPEGTPIPAELSKPVNKMAAALEGARIEGDANQSTDAGLTSGEAVSQASVGPSPTETA